MLTNKIHIFPNSDAVAKALAELLVEKLNEKVLKAEFLNIAVSGGQTPNAFFRILAQDYADRIDWNYLRIFWVDERCVASTDKQSNYGVMNELLLRHVPIPAGNVFRMKGESEPVSEAERYGLLLKKHLPESSHLPVFDLILLGMGDDGHTASIFPSGLDLLYAERAVAVARHPQSGQYRITLTGKVLRNAVNAIFVICGKTKAEVIKAIIHEEGDFRLYPAYHVLSGSKMVLYLDENAAELL